MHKTSHINLHLWQRKKPLLVNAKWVNSHSKVILILWLSPALPSSVEATGCSDSALPLSAGKSLYTGSSLLGELQGLSMAFHSHPGGSVSSSHCGVHSPLPLAHCPITCSPRVTPSKTGGLELEGLRESLDLSNGKTGAGFLPNCWWLGRN